MPAPDRPSPFLTVRIIHWALLAGPIFIVAALWLAFGGRVTVPAFQGPAGYAVYAGSAAGFAFGFWWRGRIPSRASGESEWDYWRVTMPKALVLWGVLEGMLMLGAVIGLLAGQPVVATVLLLIYLGLMLLSSPARLAGDA